MNKKLHIILKNTSSISLHTEIFGREEKTFKDISVDIFIEPKRPVSISMKEFLDNLSCLPKVVSVQKTSSNRRLYFYHLDNKYLELHPIVPQISPRGLPHHEDEEYIWIEKEHNVADTNECFILDFYTRIFVDLMPHEEFLIQMDVLPQPLVSDKFLNLRNIQPK